MTWRELIAVFVAGGCGATLRVTAVPMIDRRLTALLPMAGTLVVNLVGCFLIGALSTAFAGSWRAIVLGGFLGGFTTYSAFALLSWDLLTSQRIAAALAQISLHLLGGLALAAAGVALGRRVFPLEQL